MSEYLPGTFPYWEFLHLRPYPEEDLPGIQYPDDGQWSHGTAGMSVPAWEWAHRATPRERRPSRRGSGGRGRKSDDGDSDPPPLDDVAVRRARTRVKVAAWRARHREVCPSCGEFFGRLDEFTGWCWLCTREERKRVAA
jgi:hypothetical protein